MLHPNADLITRLYTALAAKDGATMGGLLRQRRTLQRPGLPESRRDRRAHDVDDALPPADRFDLRR